MNSFRSEPFLWIHLAGLAVVPLSLLAVWLGLAAGDPVLPVALEIAFLAIAGIVPVAWMQWQRPFDIFRLLVLAVRPDRLTPEQRKILRLFKTLKIRIAAIAVAIFMVWAIWQIYRVAPLAAIATPLSPRWHLLGLFGAAIAFGLGNLFLQVPVSVLGVLLTSDARFAEIEPYEVEQIGRDFFVFGIRIPNLFAIASLPETTPPSTTTKPVNPPKADISKDISTEEQTPVDARESEAEQQEITSQEEIPQTPVNSLENEEEPENDNQQDRDTAVGEVMEAQPREAEKTAAENISPEENLPSEEAENTADVEETRTDGESSFQ
ncbi:MAG: low-complexity tail membrane protein [Spirulina sp.]